MPKSATSPSSKKGTASDAKESKGALLNGKGMNFVQDLTEAKSNTYAVIKIVEKLSKAASTEEAVTMVLDTVREAFDWAYGSFWKLDTTLNALKFHAESGTVNAEFEQITQTTSFKRGIGLSGRVWASG